MNRIKTLCKTLLLMLVTAVACTAPQSDSSSLPLLKISDNGHYFATEKGDPFFWLGDTGWLLFKKLNREDAEKYLEDRKQKGFNVIQVMVLHDINDAANIYGDSAIVNKDISKPVETEGNNFEDSTAYDFWDHADYIIKLAEEKGLYMALVPLWGSNVKTGLVSPEQAAAYGKWIANRYKDYKNIIWLNGGDIFGTDSIDVWNALGAAINETDPNHLITFHPRGRMQSSMWFQNESWLDFNMIQSGHRAYEQDDTELHYGEDNWRYVETDFNLTPVKPTIDGEPSYEGIPHGLHDTLQPFWKDCDVRRYGYWSVFAGAFGYTYGHSAVMQFFKPEEHGGAYGAKIRWKPALNEPGAQQMVHLKDLMLSRSFFNRVPDQSLIAKDQGEKYEYLVATRGTNYAFIYTYTGRNIPVAMGKIEGEKVKASWFDPRTGEIKEFGTFDNKGVVEFDPPGEHENGNDWVLILDSI